MTLDSYDFYMIDITGYDRIRSFFHLQFFFFLKTKNMIVHHLNQKQIKKTKLRDWKTIFKSNKYKKCSQHLFASSPLFLSMDIRLAMERYNMFMKITRMVGKHNNWWILIVNVTTIKIERAFIRIGFIIECESSS